jgi:hemolysin D
MKPQRATDYDPGLVMLEMMLRLHNIEAGPTPLRHQVGAGRIGAQTILRCTRWHGLRSRIVNANWSSLGKYPLPGIAMVRNGGFLLLGAVSDDKALVLAPDGSRPHIVSRRTFESEWDGRLLYVAKDFAIQRVYGRVLKFVDLASMRHAIDRMNHLHTNMSRAVGVRLGRTRLANFSIERVRDLIKAQPNRLDQVRALAAGGSVIIDFAERARKLQHRIARPIDEARRRSQEIAFLPAALEIVETPPSPLGRAIAISIAALFAMALAWSCFGSVDVVATATGKIVPNGGTKAVQPFESGVVRAIKVHDGQIVAAGDVLVELDSTMSSAELGRIRGGLQAARLDVARLQAALSAGDDHQAAFHPPAGVPLNTVEMHRRFLASQVAEQDAKLSAVDSQIAQKEAERATIKATIGKLEATLAPLQQKVDIREQLVQKELGSKLTYLTEYQELLEHKQEISVQQSRYQEASAAVASLKETRAKTAAEYQRGLLADLAGAEQKSADLAHEMVKAEQRTNLQTLRAPVDGMVQQLAVHTVGGVVTPAQTLMLVVPAGSGLEIEATIPNRDIGFIAVGQDAAIKIDTFNFTRYGLLHGKLLSVSQDAVARNSPRSNNERVLDTTDSEPHGQELVYSGRISIDRDYMDVEDKRVHLAAGMATTVEIRTGSRKIISYLLSPLLRYGHESMRER